MEFPPPNPQPTPPAPPPPVPAHFRGFLGGRRPWSAGEIIAWSVVFLIIALTVLLTTLSQLHGSDKTLADTELRFESQIAVGQRQLLGGANGGGLAPGAPDDFSILKAGPSDIDKLDERAQTPEDHFRVAIVAGELLGSDKALERLHALAQQTPDLSDDAQTAAAIYAGQEVPTDDWRAFRLKYQWFADLLASHGKPADDPTRKLAIEPARNTILILLAYLALAGGLASIGLVLLIVGIFLLSFRRLKLAFSPMEIPVSLPPPFPLYAPPTSLASANPQPLPPPMPVRADRRAYLYGFALYLCSMEVISIALGVLVAIFDQVLHLRAAISGNITVELILSFVITLGAFSAGLFLPFLFRQSRTQWRMALGLHRGRGIFREIGAGLLGYIAGLPIVLLGMILFAILSHLTGLKSSHPVNDELGGSTGQVFFVFILACVLAPIVEELMFRGALFAHLRERFGWWISAPIVAFVFAAIHPQGFIAIPVLGALALVFAGIREWRGSIIGCMAAHALHNGLTLALALSVHR
jgi:membrane protease YdiL (CAAX protease family)